MSANWNSNVTSVSKKIGCPPAIFTLFSLGSFPSRGRNNDFSAFRSSNVCFEITFAQAPGSTRALRCNPDEKRIFVYVSTVPSVGIIA